MSEKKSAKRPNPKSLKNLKRGGSPGRPKGVPNKVTTEIAALARSMTTGNEEWVKATTDRMIAGKEAPGVVVALLHYGHGKPKETVELSGPDGKPIAVEPVTQRLERYASEYLRSGARASLNAGDGVGEPLDTEGPPSETGGVPPV